jgi:hypothetical protein
MIEMFEIECPNCQAVRKMSLTQPIFEGPYRCWKCRSLYSIVIANKKLQSCTPMTEEEFTQWQKLQEALKKQSEG